MEKRKKTKNRQRSKLLNKCSRFLKIVMNNFLLDFVAFGAVLSGVLVITSTNPVISVLFLISVFINAAGYLLLLGVGFIGISYLIVYIGAIAILFLFVVMMLNIRLVEIVSVGTEYTKNLPLGLIVGSLFFFEILSIVPASTASSLTNVPLEVFNYINGLLFSGLQQLDSNSVHVAFTGPTADNSFTNFLQIETIGQGLYTYGSIWLLLASVILLLAMVGPITLCLRSTREN
jgi:NADH-ubiquinone oxidoreductase chain 6